MATSPMPTTTAAEREVEEEDEEEEYKPKPKPKPPPPAAPTGPTSAPPDNALGFPFGEEHRNVMSTCTGGGGSWHKHAPTYSCSKALEGAVFDGEAVLNFCKFRLCGVGMVVTLEAKDRASWTDRFAKMRQSLEGKFGPPSAETAAVPTECEGESFMSCLDDGRASMEVRWEWQTGHKVTLKMSRKQSGDGPSAIRYVAVAPNQ